MKIARDQLIHLGFSLNKLLLIPIETYRSPLIFNLKDKKTGEKIRFDEGKPWETGHEAHDHYHRINPNR